MGNAFSSWRGYAVAFGAAIACTLAGAKDELTEILLAEMQEAGGKGTATIMGHGIKLPPAAAAVVNGAASHALDYDDEIGRAHV